MTDSDPSDPPEATPDTTDTLPEQRELGDLTPAMERRNGVLFFCSYVLIYLAAPVTYIGIVQAALCDKLGASYTVASLPASFHLLGGLGPLICSWLIPYRRERATVVWSYGVSTAVLAAVGTTLLLPFSNAVRIAALLAQGLIQGISNSVAHAFGFQCLRRGTTTPGRARIFGIAFGFTPLAAVAGSLSAQFVLNQGLPFLPFPLDFAFLYGHRRALHGHRRLSQQPLPVGPGEGRKKQRPPLLPYLRHSIGAFFSSRPLALTWMAYVLWYFSLSSMPNLSLYTRQAMGREPKEFSGLVMALRFGFKSVAGFLLGMLGPPQGDPVTRDHHRPAGGSGDRLGLAGAGLRLSAFLSGCWERESWEEPTFPTTWSASRRRPREPATCPSWPWLPWLPAWPPPLTEP